jgi:hypothetical protein
MDADCWKPADLHGERQRKSRHRERRVVKILDPACRPRELVRQARLACSDLIGVGTLVEERPQRVAFRLPIEAEMRVGFTDIARVRRTALVDWRNDGPLSTYLG